MSGERRNAVPARAITTHRSGNILNDALIIHATGEPGPGGACLAYTIRATDPPTGPLPRDIYTRLEFQNGNPAEKINGISNEALLAIVADRLEGFQSGPFVCLDNEAALEHVKCALKALSYRTQERIERGVEGTLTV